MQWTKLYYSHYINRIQIQIQIQNVEKMVQDYTKEIFRHKKNTRLGSNFQPTTD